jgi:hypothetical protein
MTVELETRIRDLKQFLFETDFKIIKCYEAQLLEEEMPYDFKELISLRRSWRQELNLLQEEIADEE